MSDATELPDRLIVGRTWDQSPEGFSFRTHRRTVTEHDLMTFVTTFGFNEELFTTSTAAVEEAGFEGRLVPGALTFCLAEGLVIQTGCIAGTGMAFMGTELKVRRPVYVGDTIEVTVEVVESRESSRPNRGVVKTRNLVRNQRGEVVLEYSPARMVKGPGDE